MANISVTGLASGLPADLVDKLVALEQQPLTTLADKKVEIQTRQQAVQDLNSRLLSMKATMEGLDAATDLTTRKATSSDTGFATVSADTTAATGSYTLTDIVLADGDQKRHTVGVASKTDPLASGTFAFTYAGGAEQQVSISGGETLEDLVAKINDLKSGVTAGLLNDGTRDYLVLTGDDTGAANTIDITANTTITGFEAVDFTDTSTEQDASFKIDGLPVTGTSDTFTSVLTGVTINLQKATGVGESVTLTVSRDTAALTAKVQAFVDAYNNVNQALQAHSEYDKDTGKHTVLFGDPTIRSLQYQMRRIINTPVAGATGTYDTLAQLGITTDKTTGDLSIDSVKLQKAIDTDIDSVGQLFYTDTAAGTEGYATQLATYLDGVTNPATGVMHGKSSAIDDQLKAMDRQIQSTQRRVDLATARIRQQFANLESLVSELNSKTSGALASLNALVNNPISINNSNSSSSSSSSSG